MWSGHTFGELSPTTLLRHAHQGGARSPPSSSVIDFKPRRPVQQWTIARQVRTGRPLVGGLCMNLTGAQAARRNAGSGHEKAADASLGLWLWRGGTTA